MVVLFDAIGMLRVGPIVAATKESVACSVEVCTSWWRITGRKAGRGSSNIMAQQSMLIGSIV